MSELYLRIFRIGRRKMSTVNMATRFHYFQGLAMSVNCVSAYLMKQIGPQPMIEYAKRLGITSDIPPYPSICLGTPDISLYEMVGAYSTFANKGVYTQPQFLLRMENKNGKLIKEFNTVIVKRFQKEPPM